MSKCLKCGEYYVHSEVCPLWAGTLVSDTFDEINTVSELQSKIRNLETSNRDLRDALKAVCEYESVSIDDVFTNMQKARALLSRLEKENV